jgi:hypothetical protein
MNRNYYCKVNSQKEAEELLDKLKDIGEQTDYYFYNPDLNHITFIDSNCWALSDRLNYSEEFENKQEVPANKLIQYVKGELPKEDVKFEKGKWYKFNNCWYAKFEVIHGSGTYWKFSENIDIHGKYNKNPHQVTEWKTVPIVLVENLSEIQQYLPDGHLDKQPKTLSINDLVEGGIYYFKNSAGEFIFKYDGNIGSCKYIRKDFRIFSHGDFTVRYDEIKLAVPQERKWLLTCIKQDKFIEQSELDKYDDEGNLIQNFEFGKWYKANSGHLYYIKSKKEFYGFNNCTGWVNYTHGDLNLNGFIPATDQEVSDRLLEYARSKYPVGTKFKSCYQQDLATVIDLNYKWVDYYKAVENSNGGWVYQLGKWAEIVESPKEQVDDNEIPNSNHSDLETISINVTHLKNDPRYIGGIDSISEKKRASKFIEEQLEIIFQNPLTPKECTKIKIPKLIDRGKLNIKIKETKVKQIKL